MGFTGISPGFFAILLMNCSSEPSLSAFVPWSPFFRRIFLSYFCWSEYEMRIHVTIMSPLVISSHKGFVDYRNHFQPFWQKVNYQIAVWRKIMRDFVLWLIHWWVFDTLLDRGSATFLTPLPGSTKPVKNYLFAFFYWINICAFFHETELSHIRCCCLTDNKCAENRSKCPQHILDTEPHR